jgi:MFS family permease
MSLRSDARARRDKTQAPTAAQLLWRHRDFNKLWAGQGISTVGSQVTLLALPLTAVLYMHASTAQVGLLSAAGLLPYAGPSLLYGVLADRMRKRPLMIMADMGRTLVIALIPVLAWTHSLNMPVMYAVALIQGNLTVLFDVCYRAYLPSLVGKEALLAGNSRLSGTASVAQVAGPGLSGTLMELLGAPFALLADAASFVVSWASLLWIRTTEPPPEPRSAGAQRGVRAVISEVRAGLSFIFRSPSMRPVTIACSIFNFFSQLQITLFLVYAPRVKHISSGGVGLIFVCLGIGGVIGSLLVRRCINRFGYGPILLIGYAIGAAMVLCIALVPGRGAAATAIYCVVYFTCGVGLIAANTASLTLRQIVTPPPLQGRTSASYRFAIMALMPFSAALAGVLGEQFGLHTGLFICSAGMPLSVIILWPVRKMRDAKEEGVPAPARA